MSWLARAILCTSAVVFNASRKLSSYAVLQYAELYPSLYTWTSPPLYVWHQPAVKGHYEFLIGGLYVVFFFLGGLLTSSQCHCMDSPLMIELRD